MIAKYLGLNSANHKVEKPASLLLLQQLQLSFPPCRSWERWCAPVVQAIGKAEARRWLETRLVSQYSGVANNQFVGWIN